MTPRFRTAGALRPILSAALLLLVGAFAGCTGDAGPASPAATDSATATPAAIEPAMPAPSPTAPPDRTGIYPDSVVFGQSAAFEGPAQELGRNMRLGIEAAFHERNGQGGVHGRQLELIARDDGYEPDKAVANTRNFINEGQVFALIGAVGTPTSRSATPVAADAGIPYIAPFTGAGFLRDPEWDNIINLRASYAQETEAMVDRLTTDLGIQDIAIVYQDDSFGRAGYSGATAALERRGMEPSGIGVYPRNTTAVKKGLLDIQTNVTPEAVIIIGAYNPVGELILWARHSGLEDAIFMTVSFVGSNALAEKLGAVNSGVYVTQVVPFPTDSAIPVVSNYLNALSEFSPETEPGFVSLEGYLAGRLAIIGLERCGTDVHRDCFLEQFRQPEPFDIDGFRLQYGATDNQGSDTVFLTTIGSDGKYRSVTSLRGDALQ